LIVLAPAAVGRLVGKRTGRDSAVKGFDAAVTLFLRSLALTLALGGMLLRAALPAGWMPNVDGPSGATFEICSVDGLHRVPQPGRHSADDHNQVCAFAAAAHLASPQIPATLAIPVSFASSAPHVLVQRGETDPDDPGHAPRGPPASV
jgi:hypothetical protein